jgi:RNA polymerase sigma-70 factor (ECF subfamily)
MTIPVFQRPADQADPAPDERETDEARLVRESVAGDGRSFDCLVRIHSPRVFRFLCQMTRQRQDAEDLTQQTFIRAFHSLARYDPRRPIINWLLTIARNCALNHFRSAKRWEEIPEHTPSDTLSPSGLAEQKEQAAGIWERARAFLPQRQFEAIWLRFGESLSTRETADLMGLTQTHVKVLIFRARQRLLKGEMPS